MMRKSFKLIFMKKIYVLIIILIPILTFAQTPKDSVRYYQKEMKKLWDDFYKRYTNSSEYTVLQQGLDRALTRSSNYEGYAVFGDVVHSDYTQFNTNIAQNGFTPLNAISFRLGYGATIKTGRVMFDCYVFAVGFNNTSDSGNEKIKTSLSDFAQLNLGLDLLRSRTVSLYPYAGLSFRFSNLEYSKPPQTNSGYTNISNIVTNDQSVESSSLRAGYQAGIGLDILAFKTNKDRGATILFAKFGTDRPVWPDKYKIDGIGYSPGFKQGQWVATFGFKFVARK
jgi:hypothetical protein